MAHDAAKGKSVASPLYALPCGPFQSRVVGHEPQPLSDVRRADAASWQYGRPAGVAFRFQISENSVDPAPSNRRLNLLTKDCCRLALADESHPDRPQMALVIGRLALPGCGEWLTGAGAGPNKSVVTPPCKSKRIRPSADPGKEVALSVSAQVVRFDINDAPLIDIAWSDVSCSDEIAEPLRGIGIDFVVVGCRHAAFPFVVQARTGRGFGCTYAMRQWPAQYGRPRTVALPQHTIATPSPSTGQRH